MLNRKCAVLPHDSMDDATPEVAIASSIFPCPLVSAMIALYRNVFHILTGPSIKNRHAFVVVNSFHCDSIGMFLFFVQLLCFL